MQPWRTRKSVYDTSCNANSLGFLASISKACELSWSYDIDIDWYIESGRYVRPEMDVLTLKYLLNMLCRTTSETISQFRITGPLVGESTGDRCILLTKAL